MIRRRHSLWLKVFVVIFLFLMVPSLAFSFFSNRITTDSLMEQKRQSDLRTINELITILTQYSASAEDAAHLIGSMPSPQCSAARSSTSRRWSGRSAPT